MRPGVFHRPLGSGETDLERDIGLDREVVTEKEDVGCALSSDND